MLNLNYTDITHASDSEAEAIALELFSYENFLLIAIAHFRSKSANTGSLTQLDPNTAEAIQQLAALLPPPLQAWEEFATTLEYPMSLRLTEIKQLEQELIHLEAEKPFRLAEFRKTEARKKTKIAELQAHIIKKAEQKQYLLNLTKNLLLNPSNQALFEKALQKIVVSKAHAKKYETINTGAQEFIEMCKWIGSGPFPFNPVGQILMPLPFLVVQFCHINSHRHNPNKISPNAPLQTIEITGTAAGIGATIFALVATASTPFLPVVAAGAILIGNIISTITAVKRHAHGKDVVESFTGKKIRMKGHRADIIGNIAGTLASTGLLGMTLAIAIGATTIAFPPATLALLGTIGLSVSIVAITLSAGAYFRRTALLREADKQKLLFDFEKACAHGMLNDLNFSLDDKRLRSLASNRDQIQKSKPSLITRFKSNVKKVFTGISAEMPVPEHLNLLSTCSLSDTSSDTRLKDTARQFERILSLGFIPNLVDAQNNPITFPDKITIQITQHSPPNPAAAIEAIQKAGGIPQFSDPKEQEKMLKIQHNDTHKSLKSEPQHTTPFDETYLPLQASTQTTEPLIENTPSTKKVITPPVQHKHKNI